MTFPVVMLFAIIGIMTILVTHMLGIKSEKSFIIMALGFSLVAISVIKLLFEILL